MFKKSTLSTKMLNKLMKGKPRLEVSGVNNMWHYVTKRMIDQSVFMNRNKEADLYYTSFGLMLAAGLNLRINCKRLAKYLDSQDTGSMDLIHYASYVKCRMLLDYLKYGRFGFFLKNLFFKRKKTIPPLTGFPHNDPQAPYSQFILLSLKEDLGIKIPDKKAILQSLDAYRVPGGGFTNIRGHKVASINATAAALAVIGQLQGYKRNEDVDFLFEQQDEVGSFRATPDALIGDILSTGAAVFVLSCYKIDLPRSTVDFIEIHGLASGGMKATILDQDNGDVEYTFYGLLGLGSWR